MAKLSMPAPGFRFSPTDVELIRYFLKRKVLGKKIPVEAIAEVDIYKYAPWDLPDKSHMKTGDLKWYFFCPLVKKYHGGARTNRATHFGFWKTTGNDRPVYYEGVITGMIKSLVFHTGKAPKGDRTNWVMYEYRLEDKELADKGIPQDTYVVCAVFEKDGRGPKNGAQYGAPFIEENWDSDGEVNPSGPGSSSAMPENEVTLPVYQSGSVITSSNVPSNVFKASSVSGPSQALPAVADVPLSSVFNNEAASGEAVPVSGDFPNDNPPHVSNIGSASSDGVPIEVGDKDVEGLIDRFTVPDSNFNNELFGPFEDGLELLECINWGGNPEMDFFDNMFRWDGAMQGMNSFQWLGGAGGTSDQNAQHILQGGSGQLPDLYGAVRADNMEAYGQDHVHSWPVEPYLANPFENNAPHQLQCPSNPGPVAVPTRVENQAFIFSKDHETNSEPTVVDQVANAASYHGPEAGTSYDQNAASSNGHRVETRHATHDS